MYIVTHGGRAHPDDFVACALILACEPEMTIHRRNPTEDEINDPEIWVVDIGGEYDPELRIFDHHMKGCGLPCAYRLVAQYLGIDEQAAAALPWWEYGSVKDCKGPMTAAKEFGITGDISVMISGIEGFIVSLFGECETIEDGETMHELLRQYGQGLLEIIETRGPVAESYMAQWTYLPNLKAVVLDQPILDIAAMEMARKLSGLDIAMSASPAAHPRNGPIWSLYRFKDDPRIDFRRLEGMKHVDFMHSNGFLAGVFSEKVSGWRLFPYLIRARTDLDDHRKVFLDWDLLRPFGTAHELDLN